MAFQSIYVCFPHLCLFFFYKVNKVKFCILTFSKNVLITGEMKQLFQLSSSLRVLMMMVLLLLVLLVAATVVAVKTMASHSPRESLQVSWCFCRFIFNQWASFGTTWRISFLCFPSAPELIQVFHSYSDMTVSPPAGRPAKNFSQNVTMNIWQSNFDTDFNYKTTTSLTVAQKERRKPMRDQNQQGHSRKW